jgi:hypothetical protein
MNRSTLDQDPLRAKGQNTMYLLTYLLSSEGTQKALYTVQYTQPYTVAALAAPDTLGPASPNLGTFLLCSWV